MDLSVRIILSIKIIAYTETRRLTTCKMYYLNSFHCMSLSTQFYVLRVDGTISVQYLCRLDDSNILVVCYIDLHDM